MAVSSSGDQKQLRTRSSHLTSAWRRQHELMSWEFSRPHMSHSPRCGTYWSPIRRWIVRNFQTLIVSAAKVCKQCLQTAWVPIDEVHQTTYRAVNGDATRGWELRYHNLWALHPNWKIVNSPPGAAMDSSNVNYWRCGLSCTVKEITWRFLIISW